MGEDSKSARTQIIIAIIGLVGVLGTALITQWKEIFPQTPKDNAGIAQKPSPPTQQTNLQPTTSPETEKIDNGQDNAGIAQKPVPPHEPTVADAERLTGRYLDALQKRDTGSIVEMISREPNKRWVCSIPKLSVLSVAFWIAAIREESAFNLYGGFHHRRILHDGLVQSHFTAWLVFYPFCAPEEMWLPVAIATRKNRIAGM